VNGSGGIAVGMATNIPPHNLVEVIDATIRLIGEPACTIEDLMLDVKGPDFPTAGMIYDRAGIYQAYKTGRGSIIMRCRTEIEKVQGSNDREQIVVTELPYQVNKARLHAKIGDDARQAHRGHQGSPRRERPRRHAPRARAEEGRLPAGSAQSAVSADGHAGVLRHHQSVDRRLAA